MRIPGAVGCSARVFERYTEEARSVVVVAQEEARALREALARGDDYIGSEHLLLGIANCDEDTVAVRLLRADGVTTDQLRDMLVASLPPSKPGARSRSVFRRARRSSVQQLPIEIDLSGEARRLLMSAGARALDDGRTLITIADIEKALRRHSDADEPPPQAATS